MYPGWLVLAGVEVVNAERTALYVQRAMPHLNFQDVWGAIDGELHKAVNHLVPYESPMVDEAPWYDPAVHKLLALETVGYQPVELQSFLASAR